MAFLALFAVVLVGGAVLLSRRKEADVRRQVSAWLDGFGRPVEKERDAGRVSALFRARQRRDPGLTQVDERTWRDLDMDLVFAAIDRTASQAGTQALYDRLRRPAESERRLDEVDAAARSLADHPAERASLTRALLRLRDWHTSYLAELLHDEAPPRHRWQWTFPVLAVLPLVMGLWALVLPRALLAALAVLVVNYVIRIRLRPQIDPWVPGLRALPAFIAATQSLVATRAEGVRPSLDRIERHLGALRFLRGAVRWIVLESVRDNPAVGAMAELALSLQEYVNMAFLLDVNAFYFAVDRIRAHREALVDAYDAVGEIDIALSVASLRAGAGGHWVRPDFTARTRHVHIEGAVHPLLANPVGNNFITAGQSWLVTGSNMSGKSTFLRTIGVNALLARTIATCLATRWQAPPFTVRSCIGRGDSLVEGKSYYLAEAEAVRDLLEATRSTEPHLFLLDELFRGTNTVERIAAGRAVLEAIDVAPHLVLVATHDIELTRWLGERFASFHFREQVADGELTFDYRLKPGTSSTRNAIALLRVLQFPESVVQLAEATVEEQSAPPLAAAAQQQRLPGRE